MRRLLIPLFFLMFKFGQAQDNESKGITIRIACGFAGVTSPNIYNVRELIQSKGYFLLKRRIFSDDLATSVLSAIALKELKQQRLTDLTKDERDQINTIANTDKTYSVCFTCTGHFEGMIKELFTPKGAPAYLLIKFALFEKN